MSLTAVFALALALSMDAFAVAAATGLRLACTLGQTLRMSLAFGLFQFFMPVLGWILGLTVRDLIEDYDHWIAFSLLAFVGGRMLYEGFFGKEEKKQGPNAIPSDPSRGVTLLLLAVATSIDALAVGLSISILAMDIWLPAAIIGIVCFGLTACGMHLGRMLVKSNPRLAGKANILGGLALVGIGIKILMEHLSG
ncbi:MAG: manganese efflux pump MntP family protein [Deltaproteobacteria bacterium]|jgi:putative Mn2+ efflux pump MntP|nr:manganese efflux pump MntP family protein [Deltaproteobacteria bacterium]